MPAASISCFAQPATFRDAQAAWPGPGGDAEEIFRRLSQLELIHPAARPQRPEFAGGRVLTAWLHVTNACNLRCPYCYVHKSAEGMDETVGRAAVQAVINSAVAHGFPAVKLKYAGGEASLNHRLMISLHGQARALAAEHGLRAVRHPAQQWRRAAAIAGRDAQGRGHPGDDLAGRPGQPA